MPSPDEIKENPTTHKVLMTVVLTQALAGKNLYWFITAVLPCLSIDHFILL